MRNKNIVKNLYKTEPLTLDNWQEEQNKLILEYFSDYKGALKLAIFANKLTTLIEKILILQKNQLKEKLSPYQSGGGGRQVKNINVAGGGGPGETPRENHLF